MTDILGMWNETAAALNQDGSTMYDWEAQFRIDPDGDSVRVTVATEQSQSRSISSNATVQRMPDGRVTLLYDYIADPTHEGTESHDFFGMTRILFDADGQRGEGHYFNYNGRYTYGRLTLTRR